MCGQPWLLYCLDICLTHAPFLPTLPTSFRLIPMNQDHWMAEGVREALMPGDSVTARVYKVNRPGLYRWPVQLELLEPSWVASAGHVIEPDEFLAPISHAWAQDQGWDMDKILEETGRTYDAINYLVPQDHNSMANEMQQVCRTWDCMSYAAIFSYS